MTDKQRAWVIAFLYLGIAQVVLFIGWVIFGERLSVAYPIIRTLAVCEWWAFMVAAAAMTFFVQLLRKREEMMWRGERLLHICCLFLVFGLAVPLAVWRKGFPFALESLPVYLTMIATSSGCFASEMYWKRRKQRAALGNGTAA